MNQQIVFRLAIDPGNVAPASAQAEKSIASMGKTAQVSAAQTAAAMRTLPAQFTDIVTQLQGGASPLTVLIQQGGQIKDSFGGIGPAARALAGYITPAAVGMAAMATGVIAFAAAAIQGREEASALSKSLVLTGNYAGLAGGQIDDLVRTVQSRSGASVGTVRELTSALVATGRFGPQSIGAVAGAMTRLQSLSGVSADAVVKDFESMTSGVAKWAVEHNKSYHFLTAAQFEHIQQLEKQGKVEAAIRETASAFDETLRARQKPLGTLEKAWRDLKNEASAAWDAMKGIGRPETIDEQIDKVQAALAANARRADQEDSIGPNGPRKGAKRRDAELRADLQRLLTARQAERDSAAAAAERAQAEEKAIAEAENREKRARLQQAADLARLTGDFKAKQDLYKANTEQIDLLQKTDVISEAQAIRARGELRRKELLDEQAALQQRITILKRTEGTEAEVAAARAEIARISAQLSRLPEQTAALAAFAEQEEAKRRAKDYLALMDDVRETSNRLAAASASGLARLVTDPLKRAQAEAEVSVQALDDSVVKIRNRIIEAIALARRRGDDARADELAGSLGSIDAALPGAREGIRQKAVGEQVSAFVQQGNKTDFAAGFDRGSQSLGVFTQQFGRLLEMQTRYADLVKAAGKDEATVAVLRQSATMQQAAMYGNLAGAAKGFFREGSTGYKTLSAAEKAFRAYELAMAIKNTAEKLGLLGVETTAKVTSTALQAGAVATGQAAETSAVAAGEASRNAAKVPGVFMAFMSALGPWGLAAAGVAIAAVLGGAFKGGGGSFAATNNGTGTVLGDSTAQSKSISNSIEALRDVDTMTMRYSAQMLVALQSIDDKIAGVSTLLLQSGGISALTSGVQTGAVSASGLGALVDKAFGLSKVNSLLGKLPVVGGFLQSRATNDFQKLFGSSQSIVGQGIAGQAQTVSDIISNGFAASYYADVVKKSKFLGFTSSTSRFTTSTDADAETKRQFGLIVASFADTIRAAATPLGQSLDVISGRLNSFVVDIGRIDLAGLTGEQISEKLSAVFGALGDNIARAALPGLDRFQGIGEGYLETVTRVATGAEQAQVALRRLGISVIGLGDVVQAQAEDIGAELVRESIARREAGTGISEIISALDGSASEIAATYSALTDVRAALQSLGLSGSAVTYDLLQGAGSFDQLTDSLTSFQENFLSDSEQISLKSQALSRQFAALGLAMPATNDQFVALVKSIDASTAAGQYLLGSVLGLSDGFSELTDAIASAGQGIQDEIDRIKGLTSTSSSYAEYQTQFAIQTAAARSGNQAAIDALPRLSQQLLEAAGANMGSATDLARVQASVLASLQATLDIVKNPVKIPGFASGGDHAGGWMIAGENGRELIATGPARVFNAGQTADIFSGAGSAEVLAELRALRQSLEAFRQESQTGDVQLAANTGKLARTLDRLIGPDDALRVTTDGVDAPLRTQEVTP